MKNTVWSTTPAATASSKVGGVATASPAPVGLPPAAPAGAKRARKPTAAASALAEVAAMKKKKKATRPAARAPSPATPTATAPARPAGTAGNKGRGRQVLDEMPTSAEMNMAEFLVSLESSHTLGLEDLNYDSVFDHQVTQEEADEEVAEEEEHEEMAEVEEVDDLVETETQSSTNRVRTHNYNQVEDLALCDA